MIELLLLNSLLTLTQPQKLTILVRNKKFVELEICKKLVDDKKDTLDGEILINEGDPFPIVQEILNSYAGYSGECEWPHLIQDYEDDGSCVAWRSSSLCKLKTLAENTKFSVEILKKSTPSDIMIWTIQL